MKKIVVLAVNKKTNLAFSQLDINQMSATFNLLEDEMNLTGSVKDLSLYDLSNYPMTLYTEEDYT